MLTPRSAQQLRTEARALMAEFDKFIHKADLVMTSGAPARYEDVDEYREDLLDAADAFHRRAMEFFRAANELDDIERQASRLRQHGRAA